MLGKVEQIGCTSLFYDLKGQSGPITMAEIPSAAAVV